MILYLDLDRQTFQSAVGVTSRPSNIKLKRGDTGSVRIQFVRNGAVTTLSAGALISLGIKALEKYDAPYLAFADGFVDPVDPATEYVSELLLNGTALKDALGVDLDEVTFENDLEFINANLEITWSEDVGVSWVSSETLKIRIDNDVVREEEGTPLELPTPETWLSDRAIRKDAAQSNTTTEITQHLQNLTFPTYATLSAANAGEAEIGVPFYDTTLNRFRSTTDIA